MLVFCVKTTLYAYTLTAQSLYAFHAETMVNGLPCACRFNSCNLYERPPLVLLCIRMGCDLDFRAVFAKRPPLCLLVELPNLKPVVLHTSARLRTSSCYRQFTRVIGFVSCLLVFIEFLYYRSTSPPGGNQVNGLPPALRWTIF